MTTGEKLKKICAERRMTQRELAEMAFVHRRTIGYIICNRRRPQELTLCNIAKALGVEVQDLL
ncbi:MAG: helix-turn-helix domain-containing protein [Clostridia bacterium]|nr:helix-turn-helix domain-containing protein [Clostridia bacterium]